MALPPLPRETGESQADIHSLYLYLQRARDGFSEGVSTEVINVSYDDEKAQDAIGTILQDTATIDLNYNDSIPSIQASAIANSSVQKVEVAKDSNLIGTRKRLNFLQRSHEQLDIVNNTLQDQVEINIRPFNSRLIASGEAVVLLDTYSAIVVRYYRVQGTLQMQGDSCLRIV